MTIEPLCQNSVWICTVHDEFEWLVSHPKTNVGRTEPLIDSEHQILVESANLSLSTRGLEGYQKNCRMPTAQAFAVTFLLSIREPKER